MFIGEPRGRKRRPATTTASTFNFDRIDPKLGRESLSDIFYFLCNFEDPTPKIDEVEKCTLCGSKSTKSVFAVVWHKKIYNFFIQKRSRAERGEAD